MSESDFSKWDEHGRPKGPPCIPQFFTDKVELTFQSKMQGRPIYEDREFVRIIIPGDRRSQVVEPVNDEHKARWPEAYKAFTEGLEAPESGTPLTEWAVSGMTKARAAELAHFHVKTVEQLATITDAAVQNLGMGMWELREKARKWLEIAEKGSAPIEQMMATIQSQGDQIKQLQADLATAIASLKEASLARAQ